MYALIEQLTLEGAFPLVSLCDVLEVSRAGYYAWHAEHQTANQRRDRELLPVVCDISGTISGATESGGSLSSSKRADCRVVG